MQLFVKLVTNKLLAKRCYAHPGPIKKELDIIMSICPLIVQPLTRAMMDLAQQRLEEAKPDLSGLSGRDLDKFQYSNLYKQFLEIRHSRLVAHVAKDHNKEPAARLSLINQLLEQEGDGPNRVSLEFGKVWLGPLPAQEKMKYMLRNDGAFELLETWAPSDRSMKMRPFACKAQGVSKFRTMEVSEFTEGIECFLEHPGSAIRYEPKPGRSPPLYRVFV